MPTLRDDVLYCELVSPASFDEGFGLMMVYLFVSLCRERA